MAGLMGSNISLTLCSADSTAFDGDKLRKNAFVPELDADIVRQGWVGLGEMLDYTDFAMATPQAGYVGFSLRMDVRKPSSAVLRLKIAEAIQEAEAKKGGALSKAQKKEIREEMTDRLTRQADFVPQLTDCLWDLEKNDLYIGSSSTKIVESVLEYFKTTFGTEAHPYASEKDVADVLVTISRSENLQVDEYTVWSRGSGSLEITASDEKSSITVQNDGSAVEAALAEGVRPSKLHIAARPASNEDLEIDFTLQTNLVISKLLLPKAEKGADRDAVFVDHADICARAGAVLKGLCL